MDKFEISGGKKLEGTVLASGSKNASLPILFATMLANGTFRLSRVPHLKDIDTTFQLLRGVGAHISYHEGMASIQFQELTSTEAPYDLVRTMRASVLMLGPFLARERRARVSLPGGCAIGSRPVDLHLSGLEKMGAQIRIEQGYIVAECGNGLRGAEIHFRAPSVGATENLMMAATLAHGETVLQNVAREPEIVDLARFLRTMGAKIEGEGTSKIHIHGVKELHSCDYEVMFDRIEAGTLLLAGPITGGSVKVENINPSCLESFVDLMRKVGIQVEVGPDWIKACASEKMRNVDFITEPYPGFPTDLQAQMMAFLAQVPGESKITESIFENRFMHVPELERLGARIQISGGEALVKGKPSCFEGTTVMATDLRASASLVLAGLSARGTTTVRRIYHLDRGYEEMEKKLLLLGAEIRRAVE